MIVEEYVKVKEKQKEFDEEEKDSKNYPIGMHLSYTSKSPSYEKSLEEPDKCYLRLEPGLVKFEKSIKNKMKKYFFFLVTYSNLVKSQHKLNNESKYKKKRIVKKIFEVDIDESSSHFHRNRVDILIEKKKFESEEERMKTKREKKLENKLEEMSQLMKRMESKIEDMERELTSYRQKNS